MRNTLAAALALLTAFVLSAGAQPSLVALEPESEIQGLAVGSGRLAAAFANGTVAVYELPSLAVRFLERWDFATAKLVGFGTLEDGLFGFVLSNGTVLALDPASGKVAWRASITGGRLERAVVKGRWVIAISKYSYLAEKGSVELDRVLVFDARLKAATFKIDRGSDIRLVYAFDIKVSGNLLLLVGIDTTCEICKLTDTYVVVYNLSTFEKVFAERVGECKADLNGRTLIVARAEDGNGFLYDVLTGARWQFSVNAKVLDARARSGEGYVLAQQSSGEVELYRVRAQSTVRVGAYPEGHAIAFLNGTPLVAGTASVYVDGQRLSPTGWRPPWKPSFVFESEEGVAILYGRWLALYVSLASAAQGGSGAMAVVTVVTEAGATVEVQPLGVLAVANSSGVAVLTLPAGSYEVKASKNGFLPASVSVTVAAGDRKTLKLELAPLQPSESKASLSIVVRGLPANSTSDRMLEIVADNGSVIESGVLGNLTLEITAPGVYTLRVLADGCTPRNETLQLSPGDRALVTIECRGGDAPPENPAQNSTVPVVAPAKASELASKLVSYVQINATRSHPEMKDLPPLRDIDGRVVELAKGVKLLVFFYTKCTGCSLLVPKLKDLNADVIMISPSSYDSEASLKSYSEHVNASGWYWVLDEGAKLTALFNVSAFPTVVLIEDGRVAFVGVGAAEEAQQLADMAAILLARIADWLLDPAVAAIVLGAALLLVSERRREG